MVKQIGYCVKCSKKREMKKVIRKTLGNRLQLKGVCAVCGTNMSVFAKK